MNAKFNDIKKKKKYQVKTKKFILFIFDLNRQIMKVLESNKILKIIIVILIFFQSSIVESNSKSICYDIIEKTEQKLNIPKNLLLSIALTESGRNINGDFVPWPWSINTKGKGLFFNNRDELYQYAKQNLDSKILNFDVGCMQINYYYHGKKFKNLYEMTNPLVNITWAGKFLIDLNKKHKSWKEAISRYHSSTIWRKKKYFSKVMNNWAYVRKKNTSEFALVNKNNNQNKISQSNLSNSAKNYQKERLSRKYSKNENVKKITKNNIEIRKTTVNETQINRRNNIEKNITTNQDGNTQEQIVNDNYYSEELIHNIREGFKDIKLTESQNKELFDELRIFFPKEISEISTINTFRYIDQSIIEDNLKRIEDYKKNR